MLMDLVSRNPDPTYLFYRKMKVSSIQNRKSIHAESNCCSLISYFVFLFRQVVRGSVERVIYSTTYMGAYRDGI
jgi:hypothetical protein